MADRIARYILEVGGDDADLRTLFGGIKSRFRSDVAELKSIGDKLDLFGSISDNLPKVQAALDRAKAQVVAFTAEVQKIEAAGGKAPKALTDSLAAAEKAAASATKELARQQQQLVTLDATLVKAGVNTRDLAAAQAQLAVASKVAAEAAGIAAAKQALGLVTLKDVAPEIAKQRAAYEALRASGVLSATEITAAQKILHANIKELNASVTTTSGGFKGFAGEARSSFSALLGPLTAAGLGIGVVTAALSSATDAAKAYNNELAKIGTITKLSKAELADLGGEARKLAQDIGVDVTDALKSLYEIIRSGVPAENSIEVLRRGALAAKAAFTDTATGAKAAAVLIDAFGVEVKDLGGALDVVVRSAQTGGPTLAEFAANAGLLGNAARTVGAEFKDVNAILNVMTDASNDAAGSAALLTKILINLAKPETQDGLHKLGLDGRSLVDTFRGLDERGLKINEFLALGVANTKAAAGLAALTNNASKLPEAMANAAAAAGTVETAVAKIAETSAERLSKLGAAYENTKIQIGETIGASSGLAVILTSLLSAFNDGTAAVNKNKEAIAAQESILLESVKNFLSFSGALETQVTPAVAEFHQGLIAAQPALKEFDTLIKQAVAALEVNGRALAGNTPLLQKAVADQIAALKELATTQIALLDQSTAAQVSTAAKTVEIQTKLNADILAVIKAGQAEVQAATKAAIDARIALGKKSGEDEAEVNKAVTKIRLDALTVDLANFKAFQAQLIEQSKQRVGAINAIEQSRIEFNRGINAAIKGIVAEGQSGLQQFADKQKEVDRAIAEGRQIAATQGIGAAEKYFKEAQQISESLKGEVLSDGTVVVSAFQGQQSAITALKKVRDAYNEASATARDKEKAGLDETKTRLVSVGEEISKLQGAVKELRAQSEEAIKLSIASDIVGIEAARATLAELTKPATKIITVKVLKPGETAPPSDFVGPPEFARGGPVWRQYAQYLAGGGPAFRRPGWSKVPGSGSGDTVPALLQEGSFVVRKAASQKYGDSMMGTLARGYAMGGLASGSSNFKETSAVIDYARFISRYLGFPIFKNTQEFIGQRINYLQRGHYNDTAAVAELLEAAKTVAANYHLRDFFGKTAIGAGGFGTRDLVTYEDWLDGYRNARGFAAGGGVGRDTVPAMLTPGEWVIPAPVAHKLGGGFLHALNNMQIPPPRVPHFAMGGAVGSVPTRGSATMSSGGISVTINAAGGDPSDPRFTRKIIAAIREVQRRTDGTT